jgi:branched-chain amino acid transport system substrate-binding protein
MRRGCRTLSLLAIGALGAGALSTVTLLPTAGAGAATATPIAVGDICSCTGPEASSVAQTTPTLEAWAKYVNSQGGIDGHQVKLIVKDDGYNPGTALAEVESFVTSNHIAALFDESDVDTAFTTYIEQQHVPVLGGQVSAAGFQSADFFVPGSTYDSFTDAIVAAAKKDGIKKLADLYCAEAAACLQSSAGLKTSTQKAGGIEMSYTAEIAYASPNFAAPCLAAKDSGATGMLVGDATTIVNKVVEDCATQGFEPKELSGDGNVALSWLGIPQFNGLSAIEEDIPWFVHNAATKPMYTALDKYEPAVTKSPNFGEIVSETWADGALLQAAGKATHLSSTPTAANVLAGLYAMPKGTTLDGLTPPLSFKKGQPNTNHCWFTMSIKNGKFVQTSPDKLLCVS